MGADLNALRRGLILKHLRPQYPYVLLEAALRQHMAEFYPVAQDRDGSRELDVDLAYLEEKGLLVRRTQKAAGIDVHTLKLTAHGLDLLERRITEPGVTVES